MLLSAKRTGNAARMDSAWGALALISSANFLNTLDRHLISVVSVQIRAEFNLTDTQYGLLTGLAFTSIYTFVTLAMGWLCDRWPHRVIMVIALSLSVWSFATFVCALAPSYLFLLITRACVAVGEGGFGPATYSLMSRKFAPQQRAWVVGIFQAVGMAGLLGSFAIGGMIAVHHGWRSAFTFAALPGLLIAMLIYFRIPEQKRADISASSSSSPAPSLWRSLYELAGNKTFMWTIIAGPTSLFASMGILQWWPLFFIRSHHLDLEHVSLILGPVLSAGLIVGMLMGGWFSSRMAQTSLSRPFLMCIWINIAVTPLFWAILLLPSSSVVIGLMFLGAVIAVSYAPTSAAIVLNCSPPHLRTTASAVLVVMSAMVGMGILPFLAGVLSDVLMPRFGEDSLRYALCAVITVNLLAAIGFYRGYRAYIQSQSDTPGVGAAA